jgi:hypothetical protein
MGDGTSGELSVEAYARIQVALADAYQTDDGDPRVVLSSYGLDEEQWNAIDREWQARISAATETEDGGIPPLVAAYAEAFAKAQRARAAAPIPFERYVEMTRALQKSRDVPALMKQLGVSFQQYMAAHAHFAQEMIVDSDLAERFARAVNV